MASILRGKPVPFEDIFDDTVFILLKVIRHPVYKDGKPTGDYDGYVYIVCDTTDFEQHRVKILETMPIIEDEKLQDLRTNQKKVFVEFIGGTVTMHEFRDKNGDLSTIDSLNAEEIKLVEAELN
nr:hypothetical protein [uncultured Blautia sp.]